MGQVRQRDLEDDDGDLDTDSNHFPATEEIQDEYPIWVILLVGLVALILGFAGAVYIHRYLTARRHHDTMTSIPTTPRPLRVGPSSPP